MDILGQSALLLALVSFALGVSVVSRNVRNVLYLSFALETCVISAWALTFFLEKIWPEVGFYRLHLFFNVLLAPSSLWFIRVMVRIRDRWSRQLLNLSLVLASLLSIALVLRIEAHPWISPLIFFTPALIGLQMIQLMVVDYSLSRKLVMQSSLSSLGLGRRESIYVGAVFVLLTSSMDHLPWMGETIPAIGNLSMTVYLFFLSQAITQLRFLNLNALFSRFLVLLVVALTLTLFYSLLVAWIENSPALFFLNSFIASFLLLMLLDPLRSLVGYFTQFLLTQKNRKLQFTLREAQRKLTGVLDITTLSQLILVTAEQTLRPSYAALFVLRSDGTKFRRLRTIGQEPSLTGSNESSPVYREVLAKHPLIQYCEELAHRGKFPVVLDQLLENEIDRSASRTQREYFAGLIEGLRALGSNLVIPLIDHGNALGFIALKVSAPPEPWGNNWGLLPVIYPYFEQAAQTMRNLEVYTRQREKERLAAIGEMAAGLAHEIRNPLGAIKGAAQFLDPSADRPESKFLNIIVEEVDRLNRVVTQFLDYSKAPSAQFEKVNLNQLIAKTIERMKPGLLPGVHLEFQSMGMPVYVMANAEQIQQVLINLVQNSQNALQGKSDGSIRVALVTDALLRDSSGEVVLSVEDNGVGIKKENMDKLFIPFYTSSPQGTGLGLSISHKIIEAHRGRIEVVSEEGRFTRVSVILPLVKE